MKPQLWPKRPNFDLVFFNHFSGNYFQTFFASSFRQVSNLMFSMFQFGVAKSLQIPGAMVVALQAVGAAAGNMVAIHNVVAASATVGLLGREGETLKRTILPTIYYLVVVGLLGWISINFLGISDPIY